MQLFVCVCAAQHLHTQRIELCLQFFYWRCCFYANVALRLQRKGRPVNSIQFWKCLDNQEEWE